MGINTILIAFLTYPILAYNVAKNVSTRPTLRSNIIKWLIGITLLVILAFYLNISTTTPIVDWVFFTIPLFTISYLLWLTQFQNNKPVKIFGVVIMIPIFGLGYLLSTVGILGLAFMVSDYDPTRRIELSNNLEYRETSIGNAISARRGRRCEVFEKMSWFPLIERRIVSKENNLFYRDSIQVQYDKKSQQVYLKMRYRELKQYKNWKDTLYLSK